MGDTPKKVLQSDRCFICSTEIPKKEKIYIFDKSSFDFPDIISSCLDVNVSCYSATSKLALCKACYIKFKKASDHLEELKIELKQIYKDRELPRAKCLLRVEDDSGGSPASCRGKSSKRLFPIATTSTSCHVSANFTATSQPIGVSPIRSHPYGLVLQAFPGQILTATLSPLPMFTSTPVALKGSSNPRDKSSEATKTVLTVQYPSKTLNKTLSGSYQAIGKALAHGVPSQIANAVMKNPTIKNHIIENTLKTLSKEVESLCSRNNPSLLRKSSKEDLAKFDFQLLRNEWRQRAPLFFSFLMTSAVNKGLKSIHGSQA